MSVKPRASSNSCNMWRLLAALGTAALVSGCFEPRAKYHRTDYKFSWQREDTDSERRSGMIYTQPPKASYSAKD